MRVAHIIKYFNPEYHVGLEDVRNAWLLQDGKEPIKLNAIIYQGRLSYRLPVSGKRISYLTLKKGLIKKQFTFYLPLDLLPF